MSLDTNKETGRKSSSSLGNGAVGRMIGRIAFALITFALITGIAASAAFAQSVIYNAVQGTLAPTYPSQPFQAGQATEFGDYVQLAGTNRILKDVTVTLVDWAVYADSISDIRYSGNSSTWTHPVTINIYNVVPGSPNTLGSLLGSYTQTVTIPWRPAEDPTNCPTKDSPGYHYKWQSVPGAPDTNCWNGIAANVTVDMSSLNLLLPNDVIIGVAYNTQTYGVAPIGSVGPYNSLNVAVTTSGATIGTDGNGNDKLFLNSITPSQYGDGGAGGTGTFREDVNWAPYGIVPIQITATPNTLYVDTDGTAGPSGCNAGSAYTTIGAAVAAAAPGDIVKVCPGTYNESPQINKSLTIQSTGGRDVTTIQLLPSGSPGTGYLAGVYVNSATADVVIDGFTITGNDAANPVLANSNVVSQASNSLTVTNSRLKVGAIDGGSNGDDGMGIVTTYASGAGAVTVTNNEFMPVNASAGRAFYINPATGNTFSFQNNQVSGHFVRNAATECGGPISNNTVTGTGASGGFGAYNFGGPACGDPGPFTYNSVTGAATGILIYGANNTVLTGNSFTSNGIGISLDTDTVTGTVAHFNRIANNSAAGIDNATASVVDAENNWWGCNYGPAASGAGCPVATNGVTGAGAASVDANPWLVMTQTPPSASTTVGVPIDVYTNLWKNSDGGTPSGGFVRDGTPSLWTTDFGTLTPQLVTTIGQTGTFISSATPGVANVATTIDGQTLSRTVAVYNASCAAVSMPIQDTLTNLPIVVPINTDEMTARGAISLDTTITFDSSVLSLPPGSSDANNWGVLLGTVGNSNGGGRTLTVTHPSANTLVISVFGAYEFQGSGSLVDLHFVSTPGLPATSSPMNFSAFTYNELNNPCATLTNGVVNVTSGTITGVVTYGNALNGGGPSPRHVPNTTVFADGAVIDQTVLTANNGSYTLSGLGSGSYTVTPSKTGDDQDALSSLDSGCIAQHVVNMPTNPLCGGTSLNATQLIVADVSGASGVTSYDAALIARYVAMLPGFGNTGQWRFTPTSTTYPNVNTNQTGDYVALLMGDVTGNWLNADATLAAPVFPEGDRPMLIAAPELTAPAGTEISIPVSVQDTTGKSILGYQFVMTYDPKVLEPATNTADLEGTISEGMSATVNSTEPGTLRVVVFGSNPLTGAGDLLKLRFSVIGDVDSGSDLSWQIFRINEGGINFETNNGRVVVRAASNDAAISGRALTSIGQPVGNARVTLTDTTGRTRSVTTNGFGYFAFAELQVGQTYTISIASKRFTFAPRTVSVTGDAVSIDMIAEQ